MKIAFNLIDCGLGNNGGSQTIVKSANVLQNLGHEVFIISNCSNRYTWSELECQHIEINSIFEAPKSDVIIATGFNTVKTTVEAPITCGKKAHWIRGFETWIMDEQDIVEKVLRANTFKIVNSINLKEVLEEYNTESEIIRPGYDFEDFYPKRIKEKDKIVFGGLYNTKARKRTAWILEVANRIVSKNKDKFKLIMFGDEDASRLSIIDKYLRQPNMSDKNDFYNEVDIWLAPTDSEGLHIPPAEAMLTECFVIGTNNQLSGMKDYLIHKQTGFISNDSINEFVLSVRTVLSMGSNSRSEIAKLGRQKILSLGNREDNMKKFVELLERI